MDLSGRLVLLKSSAKEEDYPTFTPEDIIFLFDELTCPEGVILNLSDTSEFYVLFPLTTSMEDIFNLNKESSWVGPPMLLTIRQPPSSAFNIVTKLLEHKPLEDGERYELIPIEAEGRRGAEGPQPHSTPKKKAESLASVLTEQVKQLQSQELQELLSAVQIEMRSRQDTSLSPVHEVSSILHTLLKDGTHDKHPQVFSLQWGED